MSGATEYRGVLTLDPSIANLGYAVGEPVSQDLNTAGLIRTYSKWDMERRVEAIRREIEQLMVDFKPSVVIWERPKKFRYSGRQTAGIQTFFHMGIGTGAMLAGVTGGIEDDEEQRVESVTPQKWKGNDTKQETKMRVNALGVEGLPDDHNVYDAVGIFLWYARERDMLRGRD